MKLVFATNNNNKLKEVQEMLPKAIQLLGLKDINSFEEVAETETTLEGNAKLKASYITDKYGFNCFADDTGLEVESLNGKPGVYSARFAGEPCNSENNMQKLLKELQKHKNRRAQFRTVICVHIAAQEFLFEGVCKGEILTKDNIKCVRPGLSLHPRHYNNILGKKVNNSFIKGSRLSLKDIDN